MRVLLVTSKIARPILEEVIKEISDSIELQVFELRGVPVASLATTKLIASELMTHEDVRRFDLIIIPGLSIGSAKEIQKTINVETVKGPKYLGDLPEMLRLLLRGFRFSPDVPADEVLQDSLTTYYQAKLSEVIRSKKPLFTLKKALFTENPPPLNLIYEYVASEHSDIENLRSKLSELENLNYEGIVIGCGVECRVLDTMSELVSTCINHDMFVGIDLTYENTPKEKLKDLINLSDLILNVSISNVNLISEFLRTEQAVVVVPRSIREEKEVDVGGDLEEINKTIKLLQELGFNKILVDTIVRPPALGFVNSLIELSKVKKQVKYPLLFSPANVYELIDADSPGVIALLIDIGFEIGASSVLITESSVKTRGAPLEASLSRELVYRAFLKKSPPINHGVNLLIVKDKKDVNILIPLYKGTVKKVSRGEARPHLDLKYYVRIYVDKKEKQIIVDIYDKSTNKILDRYVGEKALDLGRALLRDYEMNKDHVLYLGYELSKAETALRLGKSYVQDEDLFKHAYY
ncbi:MAG: dihydropteroate synthase-like protein [Desulfurococcaceae archaeon TW002]